MAQGKSCRVDRANRCIVIPYDSAVHNLVPEADRIKGNMLRVPHNVGTTKLLRNVGYTAVSPMMAYYDYRGTTPFKTQRLTASMLTMNSRAFVLSEMGTGKTRSTLYALDWLMQEGLVSKALIVAPLSTLNPVWGLETFGYFNHMSVGILHGTKAQRLSTLAEDHDLYVINHDGVKTIAAELAARKDIGAVVLDELATYRNARTDRWKSIASVIKGRQYVWGLTGSPTPNAPTDAWAQVKLLCPERVPKFFKTFKEQTMYQVNTFKWLPRQGAMDHVYQVMQPSVRFTRDECVELPDTIYNTRDVPLTARQQEVYDEMVRKLRIGFKEGEVRAANEGVLMSKLLQVTTGYVYTKDRNVVELPSGNRVDALCELLDEAEGKVIVFVNFIHASHKLAAELDKRGYNVAQVSGDTPMKKRTEIFARFQGADSLRVIVAHPGCMSHGLTLTAASVIVWYTPTTSLDTYEQACARITRPGQTRKTLIQHLISTPVERRLYSRLEKKASLQGTLLEMFEQE